MPDDVLALAQADLDAWLWRIDQAARIVVQRAAGHTPTEVVELVLAIEGEPLACTS